MVKARTWLFSCTCMTAALPMSAHAQTSITSAQTSSVATSTTGDLSITSAGSLTLTSGTAVTIDSNNSVDNAGTISITDADNSAGIVANAGVTGSITNSGTITIDESYTPTDEDDDGDDDGPLAEGTGRYGIRTLGAFTGDIDNSGTITIEGNNSAGIALGGTLTGNLTNSGTITVVGDDSTAISAGAVTGNVTIEGTVSAQGENAVGVDLTGDIGGALTIQGTVSSTGYRSIDSSEDSSDYDSDDLLQGGSAVRVTGNVAGGILLAVPPTDSDSDNDDEDGDGVTDSDEGTATVISYGSAPALQVGGTSDITIGAVADDGHGIVNDGYIYGYGFYSGVDATALRIGGEGGTVTVTGGISNTGTILSTSYANATAIDLASGADIGVIDNSGTISATGGGATGDVATALLIESGANLTTLNNTGTISAAGGYGSGYAVRDESGTLTTITNTGTIAATADDSGTAVALDLSANTSGVTITQSLSDDDDASEPGITGDILLGTGTDVITASSGTIEGNADFGEGGDGTVSLSGDTAWTGDLVFHTGTNSVSLTDTASITGSIDFGSTTSTMLLDGSSSFTGTISNSSNLALTINSGTFLTTSTGTVNLASLTVGSSGILGVTIDGSTSSATLYSVSGAATFASGSQILLSVSQIAGTEGSYVIVDAGSLSGSAEESVVTSSLPYLFVGTTWTSGNELGVTIRRRTAAELGLNKWESAIYAPAVTAASGDSDIQDVFLSANNAETIRTSLRQMLPANDGGTFEMLTSGSRAAMRFLDDFDTPGKTDGKGNLYFQQVAWGSIKGVGDTSSYAVGGWGALAGGDYHTGLGNFGGSIAYLAGRNADHTTDNQLTSNQYELSAFWRLRSGGWRAYVRGSAATIDFDSSRWFLGTGDSVGSVEREAKASWGGRLLSAAGSLSYAFTADRLTIRPIAAVDYYTLHQDGRTESGGGTGYNLIVEASTSDELAATGSVAIAYDLHKPSASGGFLRVELEGGRRNVIGGAIADTVAHFEGGDSFTLVQDKRTDGWLGRVRVTGGSSNFAIAGEAGAEQQQGYTALTARATLRTTF